MYALSLLQHSAYAAQLVATVLITSNIITVFNSRCVAPHFVFASAIVIKLLHPPPQQVNIVRFGGFKYKLLNVAAFL